MIIMDILESVVLFAVLICAVGATVSNDVLADDGDTKDVQFEAAFQGRCGRGSPCDQLCYELHDGMFECDCRDGFILHKNGYSCLEMNATAEAPRKTEAEEEDILYQKDASFSAELEIAQKSAVDMISTTQSPNLEQKLPRSTTPGFTESLHVLAAICDSDCGNRGVCVLNNGKPTCRCPAGRGGDLCENEVDVRSPRFSGNSWLAFPALQAAYKHVQLEIEFRPEAWDGILFLTGERDDMNGDFMALLLHQGFVEFRFDCGSGIGVVRSEETVVLNEWNYLVLYRHRWEAWIQVNKGKQVLGRSKGLFSRITFREPVFIGGPGNTTGLTDKLPVTTGFRGCIRHMEINDHIYSFRLSPLGDANNGFDIAECTSDRCSKVPCKHSGKCLMSGGEASCLCPLGFTGDLCETRLDLQVPSFNGSSYLRYPGLGSSVLSWLDVQITIKTTSSEGMIFYNGYRSDGMGDFMSIYIHEGYLEFTFDLGTGSVTIRSEKPLPMDEWIEAGLSRTGRLAILYVAGQSPVHALAPGAFTQLSLPQNLYIGGMPNFEMVSPKVKVRSSFVGCIQKIVINERPMQIISEALAGVNIANCPHPCVASPCGLGKCVPLLDYYKCECFDGTMDRTCHEIVNVTKSNEEEAVRFGGSSYLHFNDANTIKRLTGSRISLSLKFKTDTPEGLLIWSGNQDQLGDFLSLGLQRGRVRFSFNLGGGEVDLWSKENSLADNKWHEVTVRRIEQWGELIIDKGGSVTKVAPGQLTQLNTNTGLYVGGMDNAEEGRRQKYTSGLVGCISHLVLNSDFHVKLLSMSSSGQNVEECD